MTRNIYVKFEVFSATQEGAIASVQHYVDSLKLNGVTIVDQGPLDEANDMLRSTYQVASWQGRATNWDAFTKRVESVLIDQARMLNLNPEMPNAAAIAKTFRAPEEMPVDMVLYCPACGVQHIDAPDEIKGIHRPEEWGNPQQVTCSCGDPDPNHLWENPPHRSHLCHGCGHIWRPADVPTNGVAAITTTGKKDTLATDAVNWRAVANNLKDGLSAAINYGKFSGMMMDMTSGVGTGMLGYLADHLEAHPNIKVDRELLGLSRREIAKVRRDREKAAIALSQSKANTQDQPT